MAAAVACAALAWAPTAAAVPGSVELVEHEGTLYLFTDASQGTVRADGSLIRRLRSGYVTSRALSAPAREETSLLSQLLERGPAPALVAQVACGPACSAGATGRAASFAATFFAGEGAKVGASTLTVIPEPGTATLVGLGLIGLARMGRRIGDARAAQ